MTVAPVGLQVAVKDRGEVAIEHGGQMGAVGHRRDGHLAGRQVRPQAAPHIARDRAVQNADRVAERRTVHGGNGHRELFIRIAAHLAPQAKQLLGRNAAFVAEAAQVVPDQRALEKIDAGRHGRVRGEDVAFAGRFQSFGKAELVLVHQVANPF